mmetsp:Transcript_3305/g.5163  ORF Transcript_3305/g.5163 Transcript_3305/m.5163 type:complete len:237 (+) Transcript_3305:23-733(+)
MSHTNLSGSAVLESYCKEFIEDQPKIDAAVKNMISQYLAQIQTGDEHTATATATVSAQEVIAAARLILKEINNFTLLDPVEWGQQYPQDESSSSVDRLDEIARYKAALYMKEKADASGLKASKSFGRKYLIATRMWSVILPRLSEPSDLTAGLSNEVLKALLDVFSQSLSTGGGEGDAELVWCQDIPAELRARHQRRVAAAADREEKYKRELAEAVQGVEQKQMDEDSTPRVEVIE